LGSPQHLRAARRKHSPLKCEYFRRRHPLELGKLEHRRTIYVRRIDANDVSSLIEPCRSDRDEPTLIGVMAVKYEIPRIV
jgi:hypothetical protein